jgi:peroxiredoxin
MKLIAGLLLVAASLTCTQAQGLSGRRAPSWNLPDSNLKRYDLLDYRGKYLILDFMITNCVHCKALSLGLEKIQGKYASKAAFVSITVAPPETQQTVAEFVKANKVTIPILFDMGQVAAIYLKITPQKPSFDTPHLFVIDPSGNIVRDWGYSDATKDIIEGGGQALMKELDNLMSSKK